MPEKLQFSSVIERSAAILGRNLAGAIPLAIVLVGLPGLFLQSQFPIPGQLPQNTLALLLAALLAAVGQALLVGTLLYAVFRYHLGLGAVSIGMLFGYGVQIAVPGILVSLAVALITGVGLMLFVVPGLIFMLVFYVAVPAAVMERLSVGAALRRSVRLTEGSRWVLLAFQIIVWIASLLLGWFVELLFRPTGLSMVAAVVVASLISAFTSIAVGVIYHDLRRMKDGISTEEMVRPLMQG